MKKPSPFLFRLLFRRSEFGLPRSVSNYIGGGIITNLNRNSNLRETLESRTNLSPFFGNLFGFYNGSKRQ